MGAGALSLPSTVTAIGDVTSAIAPVLVKGNLVILESTSPVGTTEKMAEWMAALRPDLSFPHDAGEMADINVAHCPERVLPGRIIEEVVNNPRVIGGMTRKCAQRAVSLYRIVVRGECKVTNARTAEMSKLVENAYRDVNIAFANELSVICDGHDINVWELIQMAESGTPKIRASTWARPKSCPWNRTSSMGTCRASLPFPERKTRTLPN